ncbi:high mobility group protein 1 [[Candida] jaroonii]|uniref:High mobility group protein 1 n=1 Tax=[Candida] jaroonii TaxID=467808 RepID=A0ACA9Y968_9ASCO|nr:high mobility group protein 1 [[Candida] jaroonii]
MSDIKAAKDTLVSSLYELSKAAEKAAAATSNYYNASNVDAVVPVSQLDSLSNTLKRLIPSIDNGEVVGNVTVKAEKKKKPERDPNAPKKPLTMYFAYSFHIRDAIKKERERKGLPALSAIEMNEYVKDRWSKLEQGEKDIWQSKYRKELEVYNKEKEKYKAKLAGKPIPDLLQDVIPPEIQPNLDYDISDLPPQPKLSTLDDSDDSSDEELSKKEKKEKKRKNREEKEKKKKKKLHQEA